jgi:uncharacterized protein YdaU (DUF1376 family)
MNYFEHHIGDYAEATSHLSFVEDAAYSRCIRKYYSTEKPLPADVKTVQRLVGARTKEEREAVETVLSEFFTLLEDGWHNARCDEEIERYLAGEPERETKRRNEETRLKRHREERAALFQVLHDAGQHAPWNIGIAELRKLAAAVAAKPSGTPVSPLPATAPATPATATQAPLPTTQPPEQENLVGAGAPGGVERRAGNLEKIEDILPAGPATLPGPPLPPAPAPDAPPSAKPPKAVKHHGTEEDFTAARWIFEQVRKLNATAKEPSWAAWANDVRLMREIDGRTHKEVCELFGWAMKDTFWCQNILSPGKLREKWDQLTVRRNNQGVGGVPRAAGPSKFHGLNEQDHSAAAALHAASMKRMGIEQKPIDMNDDYEF